MKSNGKAARSHASFSQQAMEISPALRARLFPGLWEDIKEGRGTGEKENYKPLILTYEKRGRGKRNLTLSSKFDRSHDTLSEIEENFLLILDYSPLVADIREQFPLDINETLEIAAELGFKHTAEKGLYTIMTTDFYIVMADGTIRIRTVKDKEALANRRTLQKLEIERIYFAKRGIRDWGIVTPGEIDTIYLNNVRQLREYRSLENYNLPDKEIERARSYLEAHLDHSPSLKLCAADCEAALSLDEGQPLAVAKHLIATRQWGFDLSTAFDANTPRQHQQLVFERPVRKVTAA